MTEVKTIYAIDDDGSITERVIAHHIPAKPVEVLKLLLAPEGDDSGRSEPRWMRLQDGTLLLAIFPYGDTYFDISDGLDGAV